MNWSLSLLLPLHKREKPALSSRRSTAETVGTVGAVILFLLLLEVVVVVVVAVEAAAEDVCCAELAS